MRVRCGPKRSAAPPCPSEGEHAPSGALLHCITARACSHLGLAAGQWIILAEKRRRLLRSAPATYARALRSKALNKNAITVDGLLSEHSLNDDSLTILEPSASEPRAYICVYMLPLSRMIRTV